LAKQIKTNGATSEVAEVAHLPLPEAWEKFLWRVPSQFSSSGEWWSRRSCF